VLVRLDHVASEQLLLLAPRGFSPPGADWLFNRSERSCYSGQLSWNRYRGEPL